MSYRLGIDVGSVCTSATIVRDGQLRVFQIDGRNAAVSSASLAYDVWQEFEGELTADTAAASIAEVVERVRRAEGEDAEAVAVAYPPTWSQQDVADLRAAMTELGLSGIGVLSAPRAAATAAAHLDRVHDGEHLAVFDIGPRMSTISVLRMVGASRFVALSAVGTLELSGRQLDAAIYEHLMSCLDAIAGDTVAELLNPDNPASADAVRALDAACAAAKEELSQQPAASIEVDVPGITTRVRITRDELARGLTEQLAAGRVALHEAVRAAGIGIEDLIAVQVVGGTARLPLFASMVCEQLGEEAETVRDLDPILAVAAGATLALFRIEQPTPQPVAAVEPRKAKAKAERPAAEPAKGKLAARLAGVVGHKAPKVVARPAR
jgi:molecular chaperone DnaK (HSP70)